MLTDWIDQEELAETWHEITYDSYIVDVRRVRKTKAEGYSKAVAEVCKYALKFSDLSTENTWHAFLSLKGKRLTGSFGSMHGVKIPDTATPDDKPSEELPYMEMLYRFVFGPKSYYNPRNNQRRKAARLARGVGVARPCTLPRASTRAPAPC